MGSDCGGASRAAKVVLCREEKADAKLGKVEFLRRLSRAAEKLVPRETDPARAYGHQVYGMPPTRVEHWRTSKCKGLGVVASACNTSSLEFMEAIKDPVVAAPVGQLRFWSERWAKVPESGKGRVREAWDVCKKALQKHGHGTLSAAR